ncbi:GAF and ANTAR domain-containing protein [Rhodococcus triatomae]|nr:hypothetical protein G419_04163 [Rhodococcus triatomae BKS 15-14]
MIDSDNGASRSVVHGSDPGLVFSNLARILYDGADTEQVYAAICVAATLLVPGCDRASVMMRQGDEYVTVAATDPVAARIDQLERELGQGPCLDTIEEAAPQIEADLRGGSAWPELARVLVESTPVRGAMGFRLLIDERKVGALNLFSDRPGVFDTSAADHASVLTAFASVTATAATRGEDIASLRAGLESNREIGKAIGLLMAVEDISAEAAFDVLRRTSQQMNRKVTDLARDLVEGHHMRLDR